ncbi:type III-A CRISPR-associated RAMP protein Csm5 [uncultured Methanobrevibacter sp.]|uniref:type III-A CRISPR-associated RAMP protein Csm5 n=1 Tax=uncultured Methanobrevibacter sp. TaxID=253161 RepID=UPI0025F15AE4|nr:type III-A CRISPR-associated RAMP protein Csm5 [uncultured Methanobrevibacter sp.]
MKNPTKYEIPINIITPIHIGSIDTFSANEYLFLDDKVHRIDIVNFFNSSLNNRNKEKFIKLIQDENFKLSDLKYIDVDLLKSFSKYYLIDKCSEFAKDNNVQIECAVKSQNKLYIPGSSIKGAIKTALLYNCIKFNQVPDIINKVLFHDYGSIINDYFISSHENSTIFNNILRFLQIEDSSNFDDAPHLHEVIHWYVDTEKEKMFYKKFLTRYLETIPESTLKTTIRMNYKKKFFEDLNFSESMEKILDVNIISESLFLFADDLINFEIDFFSEFNRYDLVEFYEELMKYNHYNKPLILLGGANGVVSKNIYLKIYEYDKQNDTHFSENYAKLLFDFDDDLKFPKSRRFTYKNSEPLGWAQLDFSSYIKCRRKK